MGDEATLDSREVKLSHEAYQEPSGQMLNVSSHLYSI